MENLVNLDLDIKQEDADANNEMYSTKIVAAKIYSIAELTDNTDADVSQEYRGVPDKSGEEEYFYDNLFEVKEEALELSSSDNLETDEDVNVQPTHDSDSASMPFRVHDEQNHIGNALKHLRKGEVHPEKSEEKGNLYDDLFEVKEEDLELSSSDNLESAEADNDSASGNIAFGQRNKQDPKSELQYSLLCPFCGSEFSDHPEWRHHLNVVHKFNNRESLNMLYTDDTISCLECKIDLKSKHIWNLQRHRIVHLPYNRYVKCKLCAKCFQTAGNFKRHMDKCLNEKRKDPNMILLCPFCGKEFPDSSVWQVHLNVTHEFNKRETLNMDLTKDKSKCLECNIELKSKFTRNLQQHRMIHLPYKRLVKCKLCEERFDYKFRYRMHIVLCKRK